MVNLENNYTYFNFLHNFLKIHLGNVTFVEGSSVLVELILTS